MKKTQLIRKLSIVMSLLFVIGIIAISREPVLADTDATTGLAYTITNGKSTITGFTAPAGFGGTLTIPSTLGGASVTSIGDAAFCRCPDIKSVNLPNSLVTIGNNAFSWSGLTAITIPASVTNIGFSAFKSGALLRIDVERANTVYTSKDGVLFDKSMKTLIEYPVGSTSTTYSIPDGVTAIGTEAFAGVGLSTGLTSITIPSSVTSVGNSPFCYYSSLNTIIVDAGNTSYKSMDGMLFSKDGTVLICCPGGKSGSLTIPNGVTSIGYAAFDECSKLTSITIPNSVTSIENWAFGCCYNLASVTIPNSVMIIKDWAFSSCHNLTNIAIPSSVTSIGVYSFAYCNDLGDAYFYGNAPALGEHAFDDCADGFTVHYLSTSTGYTNPWNGYKAIPFTTEGGVSYQTHVQDIGWQGYVSNGATAGTSGQSKRLEAIKIKLDGISGGIEYRTHIQDLGWQDWIQNDNLSGTSGLSKRLEAIQIRLTGDAANLYDVYYRVHAQNVGWMGWAKNGESAGTAGYSYRLEAIEIVLVKKGDAAPGSTANRFAEPGVSNPVGDTVSYKTHVQDYGWMNYVCNGVTSGTSGESKRMEAIQIKLQNMSGDIEYRTHVQDYGWMNWVSNDALSGTSGESKRLEAIEIRLTGAAADNYDIYYRVHAQNFGWMGWAKNGESAGTAGYSYRLEAVEIVLVPKGGAAPGATDGAFKQA